MLEREDKKKNTTSVFFLIFGRGQLFSYLKKLFPGKLKKKNETKT